MANALEIRSRNLALRHVTNAIQNAWERAIILSYTAQATANVKEGLHGQRLTLILVEGTNILKSIYLIGVVMAVRWCKQVGILTQLRVMVPSSLHMLIMPSTKHIARLVSTIIA